MRQAAAAENERLLAVWHRAKLHLQALATADRDPADRRQTTYVKKPHLCPGFKYDKIPDPKPLTGEVGLKRMKAEDGKLRWFVIDLKPPTNGQIQYRQVTQYGPCLPLGPSAIA